MGTVRLILGSASPRRRELLQALGIAFEVQPSRADETLPCAPDTKQALQAVALRKARYVARASGPDAWVLAADTEVLLDDQVLGKPSDREQARLMLQRLSDRQHQVVTAVALVGPGPASTLATVTEVRFRPLSAAQIEWYTALEEPYDKAGGYAIQGQGAFLVESISGSYTNVVGLPMAEVATLLEEIGITPWSLPPPREAGHG